MTSTRKGSTAAGLALAVGLVLAVRGAPHAETYTAHATPVGPLPGGQNRADLWLTVAVPVVGSDTETSYLRPDSSMDLSFDPDTSLLTIEHADLQGSDTTFQIAGFPVPVTGIDVTVDPAASGLPAPQAVVDSEGFFSMFAAVTASGSVLGLPASGPSGIPVIGWFLLLPPDGHGQDAMSISNASFDAELSPLHFAWPPYYDFTFGGSVKLEFQGSFPVELLHDEFESGDTHEWSSASSNGGALTVDHVAALAGSSYGLHAQVDGSTGEYLEHDLTSPALYYRGQFAFDTADFDPGEASGAHRVRLFLGLEQGPSPRRVLALVLKRSAGQYAVEARARLDDDSQSETGFFGITPGYHVVAFELAQASSPAASDGFLRLSLDGHLLSMVTGLANSGSHVDLARFGALSVKAGASGSIYLDDFASFRTAPPP